MLDFSRLLHRFLGRLHHSRMVDFEIRKIGEAMYTDTFHKAAASIREAFHTMYKVMKKMKYIKRKAWQRSSRNHPVKSHCRHARTYKRAGYRYKGGK